MISAHLSLSCSQLSDAWSDGSALTLARPGGSAAPLRAQAPPHRLVREGGASRRRLLPGGGGEGLLRAPPQPRSPSSGASFPARAPAPALGSPLASEGLPGRHRSSARRGAGFPGRAHPEAGPARRRGGAALPQLPESAPPLAPPARETGRGGRGQEAASAPGSAAAGVGAAGAAEPAPRAAAAGAGGRDKGDAQNCFRPRSLLWRKSPSRHLFLLDQLLFSVLSSPVQGPAQWGRGLGGKTTCYRP
ncbi:CDC42 small effector protein 2 isoform X2 [Equus asinus]|uniref:CDC42 small effector protein 2 isoform X2 n=1 Tax=Equus asinus TaxID=9793 RepID=UPI0038F6C96E